MAFIGKPSLASSWTNPYLRSRDREQKRGKAHHTFWWEQPLSIDAAKSLSGTKKTRMMIPNFVGNNLFGWTTCMGSSQSLLITAPSCPVITGLWVDNPLWQRLSAVEA